MEDDLNIFENGRQPQYFGEWKTLKNGRRPHSLVNRRQPKFVGNWKRTSIFCQIEDHIHFTFKWNVT